MSFTKASNISFVPLIILDTGKAHRAAAKFMKWLCYVAIPGSRCQKNKSIAIGNDVDPDYDDDADYDDG